MSCCKGPGYASPLDAFKNGPREELLYVVCVQPDNNKQDYLATVDVDPKSPTYNQVIYRTYTGSSGDELHHSGWNVCSSCHDNAELKRDLLILPALHSCKVFAIDVGTDPRKPKLHKVIDGSEIRSFNCSFPHTTHCLADGNIMISTMGDKDENNKGDFVLIDSKTFKVTGTWTKGKVPKFGYDFWYQPYHDVMIASEFGNPNYFKFHRPNYGHHRFPLIDASSLGKSHYQVIDGSEMRSFNCSFPHTAHCLATGEIMISTMGDKDYEGKGDFLLIDSKTLKATGTWTKGKTAKFGYDFWYQPYHDVMVSSEWGTPKYFKTGFHPEDIENKQRYGTSLNIYKWSTHELQQVIDLGQEGCAPLEIRFLHDPKASQGFVGCAVEANVFRFYKDSEGSWKVHKVIDVPAKKVSKDGVESELNGLMSDILISLDDKYLYFSCWLHGDVRQYDISDPEHPKLVSRVQLGGKIVNDDLKVVDDKELKEPPKPVTVKGKRLWGAPQMLQLSLDGKRLYVSSSLYSPWDKQFYPKMTDQGGWLVKLDVDTVNGGMKLDPDFLVDFGNEPNGPVLPHEMRYPGGDCTSDIWLAEN